LKTLGSSPFSSLQVEIHGIFSPSRWEGRDSWGNRGLHSSHPTHNGESWLFRDSTN